MKRLAILALFVALCGFGQARAAGCEAALSLSSVTAPPGSRYNVVSLRMTTNQPTLGVQLDIVDGTPYLWATSCTSLVPGVPCSFNAGGYNGPTRVLMFSYSLTPIPAGANVEIARLQYSVGSNAARTSYLFHLNGLIVADMNNEACRFPGDGIFTVTNPGAFSRVPAKTAPAIDPETAFGVVVDDGVPF